MNTVDKQELVGDGLERISESARFLGVSRSFIYSLISRGILPSVQIGRSRRVPIKAVRELAANNVVHGASQPA